MAPVSLHLGVTSTLARQMTSTRRLRWCPPGSSPPLGHLRGAWEGGDEGTTGSGAPSPANTTHLQPWTLQVGRPTRERDGGAPDLQPAPSPSVPRPLPQGLQRLAVTMSHGSHGEPPSPFSMPDACWHLTPPQQPPGGPRLTSLTVQGTGTQTQVLPGSTPSGWQIWF